MKGSISALIAAIFPALLAGCGTPRLTVDDGRALDPRLLLEMKSYGAAAAAVRPAIVRSAALGDTGCSTQYELPFEVMTSYGAESREAKIAWARTLGVNEDLRVIAADRSSSLRPGDIVTHVDGYKSRNTLKMMERLVEARDNGEPFELKLASGRKVNVSPFEICRGHVVLASPFEPAVQQYHWTQTVHPLEIFHQPITADEAEWIVLWTQGLSEQGGARMKTYAFMVGGLRWVAVLALGAAASSAVASSRGGAAAAGSSSAGEVAGAQAAGKAASMVASSAANRASLSGINRIAAGVFDRADAWAFEKMRKLGMNPRAGMTLHIKLAAQGAAGNAFVFDDERMLQMRALLDTLPGVAPPPRVVARSRVRRQ